MLSSCSLADAARICCTDTTRVELGELKLHAGQQQRCASAQDQLSSSHRCPYGFCAKKKIPELGRTKKLTKTVLQLVGVIITGAL